MSMTKGTPESSQIIWLEQRVAALEEANSVQWKALGEWLEKTAWVQESIQPKELGLHRADVLRQRIERLTSQRDALLEALKEIQDWTARATARAAIAKCEEST